MKTFLALTTLAVWSIVLVIVWVAANQLSSETLAAILGVVVVMVLGLFVLGIVAAMSTANARALSDSAHRDMAYLDEARARQDRHTPQLTARERRALPDRVEPVVQRRGMGRVVTWQLAQGDEDEVETGPSYGGEYL